MSLIKKKDLSKLTTLEREQELKRQTAQEDELVAEMGQENETRALPTVKEYVAERKKETIEQQNKDQELLIFYSKNKKLYQRYLLVVLNRFLQDEFIPKKYKLFVESSDEGIVLGITGTEYMGAFKVSGLPKYDINACKVLAVQLGNTLSRMEGNFRKTASGIIVATKAEAEVALKQERKKLRWQSK